MEALNCFADLGFAGCRDSLQRANQAQQDGQDQLRQLKAEFDDMNASFMQTCLGSSSGSEGMPSASLIRGALGYPHDTG